MSGEAAMIDGASRLRVLASVIALNARPALATVAIFSGHFVTILFIDLNSP